MAINTNPRLPRYLNNIEGKVINVIGGVPTTTPTAAALTNEIAPLANVIGTFVAVRSHACMLTSARPLCVHLHSPPLTFSSLP